MKVLLDFIAKPESNGNYNAYFGKADSQKDLSQMTVKEVLMWMKARTDHGSPSSATGRYQFMRKTLQGLIGTLGIADNRKFTPDLQDTLAMKLLKDRGLEKFLSGALSKKDFARNLSKEWASLPNPDTGRSYYDKDGLNKSLVSVEAVYKVLEAAQNEYRGGATSAPAPVLRPAEEPLKTNTKTPLAVLVFGVVVFIVGAAIKALG